MDLKKMEKGVTLLLQGMGVDLKDKNFVDTPKRVAKMYKEMLTPAIAHWNAFPAEQSDLILLRGHRAIGVCPHHLQPVEYTCHIGYIPNEYTVGLSKLARVVNQQLNQPLMQEDLAEGIVQELEQQLHPKGIGVIIIGVHGCMRYRGVQSQGDVIVSRMRGLFFSNPAARAEFMQLAMGRRP